MIHKAKRECELNISLKVQTDPKLTWVYIKSQTNLRTGIPNLYMDNNKSKITTNDQEKAETLSGLRATYPPPPNTER